MDAIHAEGTAHRAVLVVDDDEATRRVIEQALRSEGYIVQCVSGGEEALSAVRAGRPALILLDVNMPVIDGWQVLEELRAAAGRQTPVVVMTAGYDAQDRALATGAQGYLGKPFDLEDLIEAVDAHAGLHLRGSVEQMVTESQG